MANRDVKQQLIEKKDEKLQAKINNACKLPIVNVLPITSLRPPAACQTGTVS